MNIFYQTLAVIAGTALSAQAVSQSALSRNDIQYRGDHLARQVCQAVVLDDTRQLRLALRRYRSALVWGKAKNLTDDAVAGRFSCNDKSLLLFSEQVKARDVAYFLTTGRDSDKRTAQVSAD